MLRIATRRSALALWQAEHIQQQLTQAHPGLQVELVPMATRGDNIQDVPLAKVGGKGLFVKELEQAMLDGRADLAVHSMKDVPMEFPERLGLASICERDSPFDAFVSNQFSHLSALPQGARVGTSSLRRQCQLRALRPDLEVNWLRGNVQTRLGKLDSGEFDAIVLAHSGLLRLGLHDRISAVIAAETMLPAVGQGALGIECRLDDTDTLEKVRVLEHNDSFICVSAERAMNRRLQGGCQVPIGGFAELKEGLLELRGLVGDPDTGEVLTASARGLRESALDLGVRVAEDLLAQGADRILAKLYQNG